MRDKIPVMRDSVLIMYDRHRISKLRTYLAYRKGVSTQSLPGSMLGGGIRDRNPSLPPSQSDADGTLTRSSFLILALWSNAPTESRGRERMQDFTPPGKGYSAGLVLPESEGTVFFSFCSGGGSFLFLGGVEFRFPSAPGSECGYLYRRGRSVVRALFGGDFFSPSVSYNPTTNRLSLQNLLLPLTLCDVSHPLYPARPILLDFFIAAYRIFFHPDSLFRSVSVSRPLNSP